MDAGDRLLLRWREGEGEACTCGPRAPTAPAPRGSASWPTSRAHCLALAWPGRGTGLAGPRFLARDETPEGPKRGGKRREEAHILWVSVGSSRRHFWSSWSRTQSREQSTELGAQSSEVRSERPAAGRTLGEHWPSDDSASAGSASQVLVPSGLRVRQQLHSNRQSIPCLPSAPPSPALGMQQVCLNLNLFPPPLCLLLPPLRPPLPSPSLPVPPPVLSADHPTIAHPALISLISAECDPKAQRSAPGPRPSAATGQGSQVVART